MSDEQNKRACPPHIVAAGFPNRTQPILQREQDMFPLLVERLLGLDKHEPDGSVDYSQSLTMEMLEENLEDPKNPDSSAAFLAGRCQPTDPPDQTKLTTLLRAAVDAQESPVDFGFVEASMSLALRGEPEIARRKLLPLVRGKASVFGETSLAASYLAQLGDASGYPILLDALNNSNEHTRLMAVRQFLAFKPFDGQTIDGKTINIKAEIAGRFKDTEPIVRREIPGLLAEAGVTNLKKLLQPVAQHDANEDVRAAAQDALTRFG